MSGGYLNHIVLSRCEHVDEVEQLLRDTNNGGGFFGSSARNTSTMISVTDRYGNAAVFEIDGDSFTRDNITTTYSPDGSGNYSAAHDDDTEDPLRRDQQSVVEFERQWWDGHIGVICRHGWRRYYWLADRQCDVEQR